MTKKREWSLEPIQQLYERFLRLEDVRSYFYFPAWLARMAREAEQSVGRLAWGQAKKQERTELVLRHCDELLKRRRASAQGGEKCTATISTIATRRAPRQTPNSSIKS